MQINDLLKFIQNDIVKSDTPEIKADSKLFDDSLIDSVNILNLIGFIETSIGRRLKDEELLFDKFSTPKDIVANYGEA
jgi:acyl carrier protein